MILVLAIAAGWLSGLVRSWIVRKPYRVPELSRTWLVLVAVAPQLLIFQIPYTAGWFSDTWASAVLVISQLLLLGFVWFNRDLVGFRILGLGLILNLLVIILNGGLMPLAPETAQALYPEVSLSVWQIGSPPVSRRSETSLCSARYLCRSRVSLAEKRRSSIPTNWAHRKQNVQYVWQV